MLVLTEWLTGGFGRQLTHVSSGCVVVTMRYGILSMMCRYSIANADSKILKCDMVEGQGLRLEENEQRTYISVEHNLCRLIMPSSSQVRKYVRNLCPPVSTHYLDSGL